MRRHLGAAVAAASTIVAAGALPAAGAATPRVRVARFMVEVRAGQDRAWRQKATSTVCGTHEIVGTSDSRLRMHTLVPAGVVATLRNGHVTIRGVGRADPTVPVTGYLSRYGDQRTKTIVAAKPGECPHPEPIPPDCGKRALPSGTRIALLWNTPADWPRAFGPVPLVPSLHLSGPAYTSGGRPAPFASCIGASDDGVFGVLRAPEPGYESGAAALPVSALFGTSPRIRLTSGLVRSVRSQPFPGIIGGEEVRTTLSWTVTLTRIRSR